RQALTPFPTRRSSDLRSGLPPVKELDNESLRCTRTGQVLLDYRDARSLMGLIREYYIGHKTGTARQLAAEYYGEKYSGVKDWLVDEYRGAPPQDRQIRSEEHT